MSEESENPIKKPAFLTVHVSVRQQHFQTREGGLPGDAKVRSGGGRISPFVLAMEKAITNRIRKRDASTTRGTFVCAVDKTGPSKDEWRSVLRFREDLVLGFHIHS